MSEANDGAIGGDMYETKTLNAMKQKGFVTIAIGKEHYFKMAVNLLHSYHYHTPPKNRFPFAIISNVENEYTVEFDDVIVVPDLEASYMSKITMLSIPLYEQNVFIDADCLAYGNLNELFEIGFGPQQTGMLGCGRVIEWQHNGNADEVDGWYSSENLGKYRDVVKYGVNMHGGVLFFRADDTTRHIYNTCLDIVQNYEDYHFRMFTKPADEPIMALALAVHGQHPIDSGGFDTGRILGFLPVLRKVSVNICKGECSYYYIYSGGPKKRVKNTLLMHWQNCNTTRALYRRELKRLEHGRRLTDDVEYFFRKIGEALVDYRCTFNTFLYELLH